MSSVITNPTPKQRFQQHSGDVSKHREIVGEATFETAADLAMLELVKDIAVRSDGTPNYALAGFYRILGAYEFLYGLRNLGETARAPEASKISTLDHNV